MDFGNEPVVSEVFTVANYGGEHCRGGSSFCEGGVQCILGGLGHAPSPPHEKFCNCKPISLLFEAFYNTFCAQQLRYFFVTFSGNFGLSGRFRHIPLVT